MIERDGVWDEAYARARLARSVPEEEGGRRWTVTGCGSISRSKGLHQFYWPDERAGGIGVLQVRKTVKVMTLSMSFFASLDYPRVSKRSEVSVRWNVRVEEETRRQRKVEKVGDGVEPAKPILDTSAVILLYHKRDQKSTGRNPPRPS